MKDNPHPLVDLVRGDFPVVLSVPHAGRKLPEDMKGFVYDSTPGDKDADLLVYRILEEAQHLGVFLSMVKALGRRSLLDLNGGYWKTRGVPQLEGYHQAYMDSIGACLESALEHHGSAILLDVHGYAEGRHKPRPEISFVPGDIVFGTWGGDLVPRDLHPAYIGFKSFIRQAGFSVHPGGISGEYGRFIGGDIVGRFGGRNGVAAIQMEVPSRIRLDPQARDRLALTVARGLVVFSHSASK